MKRTLFAVLTALTAVAAAFFVVPSSSADGIAKSKAVVTFNKDVAPILFKSCAECHCPGEAAPMSLLSYKMVTGYLDNSAKNRNNPDPARAVRFGEPTYDEMMTGFIEYMVDSQSIKPSAAQ